jgi:hypothetical protein
MKLSDLKKNSKKSLENLIQESQKLGAPQREKDERFWTPTVDKAGNGFALIRFLPSPKIDGNDGLPWVKYYSHGFQGPAGKWYIENSLTSVGQNDPVGEYNSKLWATGDKDFQEQARAQKRKLHFISNIYVINDPGNPENNKKVFLFKYGQKIFDKIKNVMTPDEGMGEEPTDPFNFWEGQNFKLKIKKVGDFRNYDDSNFASPSALLDDDDEIEKIWESEYSLKQFLDSSNFKSYDELKKKLHEVLDIKDDVSKSVEDVLETTENDVDNLISDLDDNENSDMSLDDILKDL